MKVIHVHGSTPTEYAASMVAATKEIAALKPTPEELDTVEANLASGVWDFRPDENGIPELRVMWQRPDMDSAEIAETAATFAATAGS